MNLCTKLTRLEHRQREQNRCPLCAQATGAALATIITEGERIDYEALACKQCGARPVGLLVVILEPQPVMLKGAA